jgi:hypothetical protein
MIEDLPIDVKAPMIVISPFSIPPFIISLRCDHDAGNGILTLLSSLSKSSHI